MTSSDCERGQYVNQNMYTQTGEVGEGNDSLYVLLCAVADVVQMPAAGAVGQKSSGIAGAEHEQ